MCLTTVGSLQPKSSQSLLSTKTLQKTGRLATSLALGLSVCLLVSSKAEANTFEFQKVVDTNTPIPGGTGSFIGFDPPSLDRRNLAFRGLGSSQEGIYISVGNKLRVVADSNTPIPGGTGSFTSLFSPSLDNGNVAFSSGGIYISVGNKLRVIADSNTPIPGGTGNFTYVNFPSLDNGNVAFAGGSTSFETGIYIKVGDQLKVVADSNTPIPGGTGNFTFLFSPSLDNGDVAFASDFPVASGIYANIGGKLKVIADRNTPIPNGTGNFGGFRSPSLDNGNVAFAGLIPGPRLQLPTGIYINVGGKLKVVADRNTPIPDGTGNFGSFISVSLNDGNVAFVGDDDADATIYPPLPQQQGIYTTLGGSLKKVIARNDSLDGKIVSSVAIDREALSKNRIAFVAEFTDGSRGIYVGTLKGSKTNINQVSEAEANTDEDGEPEPNTNKGH
jgi:hypothetical protein